jgi:SAM-dependent methyltransferase
MSLPIDYWNRVASEKRFSHPLNFEWLRRAPNSSCPLIVDCGCGYGRTLNELRQAGFTNVVGIDFSIAMLSRCRETSPDVPLICNDGRSLPLKSNSIDVVLLFAVLTCIPDSTEQLNQIAEVHRILKPNGLIYISDLLINADDRNRERYERDAARYDCYGVFELPEGVVVRHHRKEWIDELTNSFESLEFTPFEVTTMNGNSSAAFQYLGRKSAK